MRGKSRKRPWRIEYEGAEGETRVLRTFHTRIGAIIAKPRLERDNPGILLEIRKHVEFDAKG